MKILKKIFSSIFFTFQLISSQNKQPCIYWIFYLIATISTFSNLHINGHWILYQNLKNPLSIANLLPNEASFALLLVILIAQLVGLVFVVRQKYQNKIENSNYHQFIIKSVFYISLLNFTYSFNLTSNYNQKTYEILGLILYTFSYILNSLVMNFTLNSKRIWEINQLFIFDLLRLILLLVNGSKVLLALVLIFYLMTFIPMTYFRPIFHISRQNSVVQGIISLAACFSLFTLSKIFSQDFTQDYIIYQIFMFSLITGIIYLSLQKWLDFCISKLSQNSESTDKNQKHSIDLTNLFLLEYMKQNFQSYKNQIILYILNHSSTCINENNCRCKEIINFVWKKQDINEETVIQTNLSQKIEIKDKNNDKNIRNLFSQFILNQIEQFKKGELNLAQSDKYNDKNKKDKKQLTNAQKRNFHVENRSLSLLRISKLIYEIGNLNRAYLILKQLEVQLKAHQLLSYQSMGTFQFLCSQLTFKKSIELETSEQNTNKFCIQYFHCQKISNRLEEYVIKSVNQINDFWTQIKIKEPDSNKLTSIMARFCRYHDKIMEVYKTIDNQKEKQTSEIRILFKFYQKILQLQGGARFFKDLFISEDKKQNLKNAASLNLKLYSDESQTQIVSFSVNQQNFGFITYKSSKFKTLIDQTFKNISDFLPKQCISFHNTQIVKFLQEENNYFKHTNSNPCYINTRQDILKPVFLETHIMAFLMINEIQMVGFLKPIIQDQKLLKTGTSRNFSNILEEDMVVLISQNGQFKAYTKGFKNQMQRMFEGIEIQNILNQSSIKNLQLSKRTKIQLSDSDYQVSLIKKIPIKQEMNEQSLSQINQFLYYILFQNPMQKTLYENQGKSLTHQPSLQTLQQKKQKKNLKRINLKELVLKSIDHELEQVQRFDEKVQKINKIFDITTKPQKYGFTKYWVKLAISLVLFLVIFIIVMTIFLFKRKQLFLNLHYFLRDFSDMQISTTQAITYLREININLWNKVNLSLIPTITLEVQKLNKVIDNSLLSLNLYLTDVWTCMDVLDYGPRIMRKQRSYVVINTFVLSTITNIVQNLKQGINSMLFSPISSQINVPYTQTQSNFLKLVSNGVPFTIPSSILLRQNTLNNYFLPNLRQITNQAYFYIPIAGFIVCSLFTLYQLVLKRKLYHLTFNSVNLFTKLNVQFAEEKLHSIQKHKQTLANKQNFNRISMNKSKKQVWKNISQMFQKTSTFAFGTFIINTGTNAQSFKNIMPPLSSSRIQHQLTQRQLFASKENSKQKIFRKTQNRLSIMIKNSKDSASNANFQNSKQLASQINSTFHNQNEPQSQNQQMPNIRSSKDKLQYGLSHPLKEGWRFKLKCFWIVLPLTFYFTHIFVLAVYYNKFMESTLSLQNNLYYRKQAMTYLWNYQYELGLFQSYYPLSDFILMGLDSTYKAQIQLKYWEDQTSQYLFGKLNGYNQALDTFMHKNICQNLPLLDQPQPNFNINYSKEDCQSLSNGVLKQGFKQAQIYSYQIFRALVIQNKSPQFYPPFARFAYLNDPKIKQFNKLYPYLLLVAQYLNQAFSQDFSNLIEVYSYFLVVDTILMILISTASIYVYFKARYSKIKQEIAVIKSCFLLIGHKNFLQENTQIYQKLSTDQGDKYLFLQ